MNYEQQKRYQKIFTEPIYLIDHRVIDNSQIEFILSGSTKNIYHLILKEKKLECDCLDAKTWCRKHKVVCKHVCFILFRVSKLFKKVVDKVYFDCNLDSATGYFQTQTLTSPENDFILSVMSRKHLGKDVMNEDLRKKYLQKLENPEKSVFHQSNKQVDPSDECPICYDLLLNQDHKLETLLSCPQCKNYMHPVCMEKWLEYNASCVYCRSDCWSKMNKKSLSYLNLK